MSQIPVAKPVLDEQEVEAVRRVILSGWVTQGPEVAAFEEEFADFVGAKHACAVSNCTTALHLALKAVGVEAGDEVITVSHTFIATANAIRYCGAVPVFVDIEKDGYNIDPDLIERALKVSGERTKKAAVTKALEEFIARRQQRRPLDLMGKLEWDTSCDYKSERHRG